MTSTNGLRITQTSIEITRPASKAGQSQGKTMKNFTAAILTIALMAPLAATAHGMMGRPGMLPDGFSGLPPAPN